MTTHSTSWKVLFQLVQQEMILLYVMNGFAECNGSAHDSAMQT